SDAEASHHPGSVGRRLGSLVWPAAAISPHRSLPYPITLFKADSASAEYSATTIGPQPDECRFFFWTIRCDVIGVDRFGASAPGATVLRAYGFTVDEVYARAKMLLS